MRPANDPPCPFEAALASAMASDRQFFTLHPQRRHRVRRANSAEIKLVQAAFRGLLGAPAAGLEVIALVRLTNQGRCKRKLIEGFSAIDFDDISEAIAASMVADVFGGAPI